MNNNIDLSSITLVDHTGLDEANWQDYTITIDPKDLVISDDMNWDFGNLNVSYENNLTGTLEVRGENADILVNGKSLCSAISNIEERLGILQVNPELESEFAELKKLGEQYRALEKQLQEKKKVWQSLSNTE